MARESRDSKRSDRVVAIKKVDLKVKLDEINKQYETDEKFIENDGQIKTVAQLVKHLESKPEVDFEATVLIYNKSKRETRPVRMNKIQFIEAYKNNESISSFRESIDYFATDMDIYSSATIGNDFTPLIGGPFNKQLYIYDYLKMHTQSFFAINHDPVAKLAIDIITNFVLGRGFRVDCKDERGLVLWRAFEKVNGIQNMMRHFTRELSAYGEQFVYWIPNGETKIAYRVQSGQEPPKGVIPRVRLVDPSTVWDIVTYPEDISRVLYYQFLFNTQYNMFGGQDAGKSVPSSKFIYQQVNPELIDHYKINCVYNEKRGRSDLFPALSYLKRLRDSVNYSIIGMQKAVAWSLDTEIDGNEDDINNYVKAQQELGSIAPAGSEFVHTTKVKRNYLSNDGSSRGTQSQAFEWAFSMCCMALGIPQQYFGTHLSGGSTKASAFVATEPVVKKFEDRRLVIERAIKDMADRLFAYFGLHGVEVEVTFPDLITADRSAKLKDLAMAESLGWISHQRAAEIAAKEFDITEFDWNVENEQIKKEQPSEPVSVTAPLTTPSVDQSRDSNNGEEKADIRGGRGE